MASTPYRFFWARNFNFQRWLDCLLLNACYMCHSWSASTNLYILQVWAGNPAKFLRKLSNEEIAFISQSATNYTNLAQVHAAENSKSYDEIEFEKVLRKKFARKDEEYDSMLGVVREIPPELILPDNVLPDKAEKALKKWGILK